MSLAQLDVFTGIELPPAPPLTAEQAKAEVLEKIWETTDSHQKQIDLSFVMGICLTQPSFTFNDIRKALENAGRLLNNPGYPGSLITAAAKNGWCRKTGQYIKSNRPETKARVIAVWESLIYA
jgi:hypothetical protein